MSFGVDGLCVDFDGVSALSDVDLDVTSGSIVSVVGGDGAGKSTLLRCLVGRIAPAAGAVRRPARHEIGYMPATSGTWRQLTVAENVDFVAQAFRLSALERSRRSADLLDRAALAEASDRLAGDLSGGMRQKLGFAMAVLHEPDLLVLDEPSTGVDPVSRVELWRLITEAAAAGTAVAMTTTYLDEAERASSITVLDGGRVIAAGSSDELLSTFPGSITAPAQATDPRRSWRRGRSIREWRPDGSPKDGQRPLEAADLSFEDTVVARMLEQERLASVEPGP